MPLFPIVATATFFIGGVGGGILLRLGVGRHWAVLLPLAVLALVPWWGHHQEILGLAKASGASVDELQKVQIAGLAAVGALTVVFLALARKAPALAAAIPGSAFLVTWYITFPLALSAAPSGSIGMDNVATVWLFIYSAGATGVLLAYWYPWSGRPLRRRGAV
jgi:hypothetical protein